MFIIKLTTKHVKLENSLLMNNLKLILSFFDQYLKADTWLFGYDDNKDKMITQFFDSLGQKSNYSKIKFFVFGKKVY